MANSKMVVFTSDIDGEPVAINVAFVSSVRSRHDGGANIWLIGGPDIDEPYPVRERFLQVLQAINAADMEVRLEVRDGEL